MLSKKVCKKCWAKIGVKWGSYRQKEWCCSDRWKRDIEIVFLTKESNPPNKCPYTLEHLMQNQEKINAE